MLSMNARLDARNAWPNFIGDLNGYLSEKTKSYWFAQIDTRANYNNNNAKAAMPRIRGPRNFISMDELSDPSDDLPALRRPRRQS